MALRENGAEPGLERAAAVEIAEERTLAAVSLRKTIKLRKERIGKFAGLLRSGTATENGGGGSPKVRAEGVDKMVPRRFAVLHASGGERQILKMEGAEIFVHLFRREGSAGDALFHAALEGGGKTLARKPPPACFGLRVKPLDLGRGRSRRQCGAGAARGIFGLQAVWGAFLHSQVRYSQYGRPSNAWGTLGILRA